MVSTASTVSTVPFLRTVGLPPQRYLISGPNQAEDILSGGSATSTPAHEVWIGEDSCFTAAT